MTIELHPDMDVLVAAKAHFPSTTDPATMRENWRGYSKLTNRPHPASMHVEDSAFHCPGAGVEDHIPTRIYRADAAPKISPCVLYLHGGGFVKGDLDSSDTVAWSIADALKATVVSVDYRLAPEHPFPAAPDDCYAAARYLAEHADSLRIDPSRVVIWGDSAGGNLATVVCLMARDRGGPDIAAQMMVYPCLTDELLAASYTTHAQTTGLSTKGMDYFWDQYLGDRRPSADPYAVPLKTAQVSNLPPAFIHIAEVDPLADDGRQYAQKLKSAGVTVQLRTAERMLHGFLRARFSGAGAQAEFAAGCAFVAQALELARKSHRSGTSQIRFTERSGIGADWCDRDSGRRRR